MDFFPIKFSELLILTGRVILQSKQTKNIGNMSQVYLNKKLLSGDPIENSFEGKHWSRPIWQIVI